MTDFSSLGSLGLNAKDLADVAKLRETKAISFDATLTAARDRNKHNLNANSLHVGQLTQPKPAPKSFLDKAWDWIKSWF